MRAWVSILGSSDTATAAADAGLHQQASGADYVVLPAAGTPGLTAALIDRIDAIGGLDATAVTQTTLLAHEPAITRFHLEAPMPIPFAAIGIDRASAALSLPVRAGSLADLGDHTIAVDSSWHERLGATMRLWLPDGTPVSLRVVAILAPGLSGISLVVDADNTVSVRPVELGALFGDMRSIVSGLSPGDRVVVNGQMHARPGATVNPTEVPLKLDAQAFADPGLKVAPTISKGDGGAAVPVSWVTPSGPQAGVQQ